jgi:hypothetical protein
MSYYNGTTLTSDKFDDVDTIPPLSVTGQQDPAWEQLKQERPQLWEDEALKRAGVEFARLMAAQRAFYKGKKPKPPIDYPEKANHLALVGAWAYVAGVLRSNEVRLARHYALADKVGGDPLNASALAKGRHKTDVPNYRGMGSRSDLKERGRFAELFFLQAEDGSGITSNKVDVAIKKYHAKQAQLEVRQAQAKA